MATSTQALADFSVFSDQLQVHEKVYEDIERRGLHDLLRSTRHFGGLVWYLMSRNRVAKLLKDMLTRQL